MSSFLEKMIYNTVGTLSVSTEKFKELMEDLIQNSQYTEDEGRRIVIQVQAELEQLKTELRGKIQANAEQIIRDIQTPINREMEGVLNSIKEKLKTLPMGDVFIK